MTDTRPGASERGLLVIGKLLRKAETTDSAEEAEALLIKAQEWATRYSIDLAVARHATERAERRELVEERAVELGRPGQKHLGVLSLLFTQIARLNDCQVLLRGSEAVVYPVGFSSDLDTVETLYRSLRAQMEREAEDWLATGEYRDMHVTVRQGRRVVRRPLHKVTARGQFFTGFVDRIVVRLERAREQAMHEAMAAAGASGSDAAPRQTTASGGQLSTTALALRAKEKEVSDFLAASYPRLGTRSSRVRWRAGAEAAGDAGRAAADRARLRGQQSLGR